MDGGHQYEIYHYLRGLSKCYGYSITVYTFLDNPEKYRPEEVPQFIRRCEIAVPVRKNSIISNFFKYYLSHSNPWPLQNILYYSEENEARIRNLVKEIKPDVIYVDMVRLATYIGAFKECQCLKVLGYDDLLSERYARQLNLKTESTNIAGAYNDKLPSKISKLQNIPWVRRFILNSESKRMRKAEIYYSSLFDRGIFVSDIETRKFNKILGKKMAYTVNMGIDYLYHSEDLHIHKVPNSLSYVGNMKTAANFATVQFIIEEVLPRLKNKYTFYVVGTCPENLREKYLKDKRIIFTGRVDDLRPAIEKTTVFLSPIAFGTGIKTKILEAFAMKMPVVTNSVGIEGIEAKNGFHCYIADDADKIAAYVDKLLESETERDELSTNAQILAKDKYQWEKNWKAFAKVGF